MATWRTKAYSMFRLRTGEYSHADGKRSLFADLVERARRAIRDQDEQEIRRVVEYVRWAAEQNSEELASVVDLAFFLPVFRDASLRFQLMPYFPEQLVAKKWQLLMEEPA
jgi:hypothetical protein